MSLQTTGAGIVVGIDGSATSTAAVTWAARDAELRGLPLRLVHVIPPVVTSAADWPDLPPPPDLMSYATERGRRLLDDAAETAAAAITDRRPDEISTEVLYGAVVATMVELSALADMMVVGCLGEGPVARVVLGSVSTGLAHHARCPVAVIHGEHEVPAQGPVVVGIDGSPSSELATALAFDEASRRHVGLTALHAWSDLGPLGFPSTNWAPIEWANMKVEEEQVLAERLAGWQDQYPDVSVRRVVVADQPAPRLLDAAEDAQLIVVGRHGRGGFTGMTLGSVSSAIVHGAQIPVVVAHRG